MKVVGGTGAGHCEIGQAWAELRQVGGHVLVGLDADLNVGELPDQPDEFIEIFAPHPHAAQADSLDFRFDPLQRHAGKATGPGGCRSPDRATPRSEG
jgi:hypothetical protein